MQLKIVTWNMHNQIKAFDYVKSEFIVKKDIDIILLQEVRNLLKDHPSLFDYLKEKKYQIFYSDHSLNGYWNIAILVKESLIHKSLGKTVDILTGKPRKTKAGERCSTWWMCYEFVLSNNQKMTIINIYANPSYDVPYIFDSTNDKYGYDKFREELEEKVKGRDKELVIMAGDLNIDDRWDEYHDDDPKSWNQSPAFEFLKKIGLVNCFKDYGKPIWTRFPWQNDHVFINKELDEKSKIIEYNVFNDFSIASEILMKYSDHVPLGVTLDFD